MSDEFHMDESTILPSTIDRNRFHRNLDPKVRSGNVVIGRIDLFYGRWFNFYNLAMKISLFDKYRPYCYLKNTCLLSISWIY